MASIPRVRSVGIVVLACLCWSLTVVGPVTVPAVAGTAIPIAGKALASAPSIEATPAALDFGYVTAGGSRSRLLALMNTSTVSVELTEATLAGWPGTHSLELPTTMQPGEVRAVQVSFAPVAPGAFHSWLEIATDDPATPFIAIPLAGKALVEADDEIPGVPIPGDIVPDTLDADSDPYDVFSLDLVAGQVLDASITGPYLSDFDLYLYGPNATSVLVTADVVATADNPHYPDGFSYVVPASGTYYLVAHATHKATPTAGDYVLSHAITAQDTKISFYAPSVSPYRSALVHGYLKTSSGGNLPVGQPVEIWAKPTGAADWSYAATVDTAANGRFERAMAPRIRTSYKAVYRGGDSYQGVESAPDGVLPGVRLTRATSWTTLYLNRSYTAEGSVEPYHATSSGNKVKIKAYKKGSDGAYHYVKSFTGSYVYDSKSKTGYRATIKFTAPDSKGRWKLVAYHATDWHNNATYGSADYVIVK